MSREIPNEIEERRVIRLLGGAAEAVPPLHAVEVEALLRTRTRSRRHSRRRPHALSFSALAAAAAVAIAVVLPLHRQAPRPQPSSPSGLVVFPEGNALSLLLSGGRT